MRYTYQVFHVSRAHLSPGGEWEVTGVNNAGYLTTEITGFSDEEIINKVGCTGDTVEFHEDEILILSDGLPSMLIVPYGQ